MSKLNKLLGMAAKALESQTGTRASTTPPSAYNAPPARTRQTGLTPPTADAGDRAAIARYDYLMQTADPQQVERIHRDAFERLTPAQRAQVEARMRDELPPHERPATSSAPDLARTATRSEMMRPGSVRGLLSRVGGSNGGGRGAGMLAGAGIGAAGGLLAAVAGGAIVSSVAGPLLAQAGEFGVDFDAMADGIGEHADGIGEQISGFGDQFGDLF